jgi:glycosyl hydrolase family 28
MKETAMKFLSAIALALAMSASTLIGAETSAIVAWPAPADLALSQEYKLTVNSEPVPVYACRVSAVPFNQVWPGYQRPLDQTELAGFACWDMRSPVKVQIRTRRPVTAVVVRPLALGIEPRWQGNTITFSLRRPVPLVVEVDGMHHALHLFASPPEQDPPTAEAPGLHYFGPGVHRPGKITLRSNESVYIAGGAVVHGCIHAAGASNVRIAGRGILDVSSFERGQGGGAVRLTDCEDVTIEGIVMLDPDVWCCSLFGCRRVAIDHVKLVGLWRYNADGIDICNSQEVVVQDSFVRAFDDALVIKGLKFGNTMDHRPVRNVQFRRCVIWCDWGRAMEIGAETCAPEIANITFENCDIVRTTHIAMDIQHGDRATVRDIRFEDIRVEIDQWNPRPRMQRNLDEKYQGDPQDAYCPTLMEIVIRGNSYSKDAQRGIVRDVVYKDIAVISTLRPASSFCGFDAEHSVAGVTIENLRFDHAPINNAAAAQLKVGPYVDAVRFR